MANLNQFPLHQTPDGPLQLAHRAKVYIRTEEYSMSGNRMKSSKRPAEKRVTEFSRLNTAHKHPSGLASIDG